MKKKDRGGFFTPDVIDPPESMQVTLCIPKNKDHMLAFYGALWELTMWDSWQPDEAHTGKELAAVWYRYFLSWDRSMSDMECDDMVCCDNVVKLYRFNAETNRPEISVDGGATWTSDPADPANQVHLLPPPVKEGGANTKCDAANAAHQHINELIEATAENLSAASNVYGLVVAIAAAVLALVLELVTAGAITPLITAVATAVWAAGTAAFELGIDAYNAYWTTDKRDEFLCALYCNIGSDGQFTEAQYQGFRTDIKDALPASPAFDIVMTSINAVGARGLSQMASYGLQEGGDCSECGCGECEDPHPTVPTGGGTVNSVDGRFINITSQSDGGQQSIYLWFDNDTGIFDPNKCGRIVFHEITGGSLIERGYNDCVTGTIHVENWTEETCGSQFFIRSATEFTVQIETCAC